MAVKELPKDEYSKYCETKGLDVCPVKITGWDWVKINILSKFGKKYTLEEVEAMLDATPAPKPFLPDKAESSTE